MHILTRIHNSALSRKYSIYKLQHIWPISAILVYGIAKNVAKQFRSLGKLSSLIQTAVTLGLFKLQHFLTNV